MKKRIAVIVFFLSVLSQVFAGGYKCLEDHKTDGNTTIHLKMCFPSSYKESQSAANERVQRVMSGLFKGLKQNPSYQLLASDPYGRMSHFCTQIHLKDGTVYRVIFMNVNSFKFDHVGADVTVYKSNVSQEGKPMEEIYHVQGVDYDYDYNYYYGLYEAQCNKYLNML